MTEQFGAIPVRAFGDTRLAAADFRLLGAIAYFDRFGRNGYGCIADQRKLAELAAVDYRHVARQAARLEAFGYIEVQRSATDRRRRVYSLIYNDDQEVVANGGDNPPEESSGGIASDALAEKVTNGGDNPAEKVTNPNRQAIDAKVGSRPKRSCEAESRDPAKRARDQSEKSSGCYRREPTNPARQGDRAHAPPVRQREFLYPLRGGNQKPTNRTEPDWNGWAAWLASDQGMDPEAAWLWIMDEQERLRIKDGLTADQASRALDKALRKRRAKAA